MKELEGLDGQDSGAAGRVSGGWIERGTAGFATRRASRLRCASWRGAGILLPDHIQAYFSAFLRFCLSRRV